MLSTQNPPAPLMDDAQIGCLTVRATRRRPGAAPSPLPSPLGERREADDEREALGDSLRVEFEPEKSHKHARRCTIGNIHMAKLRITSGEERTIGVERRHVCLWKRESDHWQTMAGAISYPKHNGRRL